MYYENNKSELLAKAKKYYEENKERLKAKSKKYYDEHKSDLKYKETAKAYYEAHKEELRAKARQYNKDSADKIRAYIEKNRVKVLAGQAAWRARKRLEKGLPPLPVKEYIPEIMETAEQREFTRKNRERAAILLSKMRK